MLQKLELYAKASVSPAGHALNSLRSNPLQMQGEKSAGSGWIGVIHKYSNMHGFRPYDPIETSSFIAHNWNLVGNGPFSKVAVGIGPRTGVIVIGSRLASPDNKELVSDRCNRWRTLFCIPGECQIPKKLLTGPWTKEKLHFLEALLEARAIVDPRHNNREEMVEKGLMDAIQEDNYRAVDLIATESCDAQNRQFEDGVFVEPSFGEAEFDFNRSCELISAFVHGTLCRLTMNVTPNTKHLKAAVLERGCWRMIVRRLLFAKWADINHDDPCIAAWIREKKLAGDEKGKWLEYQLEKSAKLQPITTSKIVASSSRGSFYYSASDEGEEFDNHANAWRTSDDGIVQDSEESEGSEADGIIDI